MQKKQLPFSVLSTKKMRKVFVATLATVTVLSQILITYPAASAAAETGTDSQTRVAATEVGDFATLSKIISEDNGITNIVLTADITMTAGILIQAKKTELTIDGNGHRLTESSVNAGSNSATIYTNGASQLKTLNVKNLTIRGSHWYGTFTNNGNNVGVTHNYENIDYAGPQFIYNQYGYANFTGKNKIVISRPLNNLGTLAEMAEVTGVTISGEFIGEHTHTASYPFNMYNSTGGGRPYFTIKDNAKVDFTAGGSALISAPANTANFTVGKNATLNMNTLRHLFQNEMANITFDNNSTTTISRTDTTTRALMEVAQTFSINPNASLFIKQPAASGAHVIRTAAAGAVININDPRELDLNANGTGANRVFSAARSTTINFNKLAEIGVFNATNKTEVPDLAWQNANFSVVQASGQAGVVQVGATSNPANIQTTFVLANAKRITMTGTTVLAEKAVNGLFDSNDSATDVIKDTTTQATIDAAQTLVDAVTDPEAKIVIQKNLDRAQELLDARNEAIAEKARQELALKAVNELFTSDKPSTDAIKETTDQAAIDAAQKLVDAVTDPTAKAALQKDLDRAQELLDAINAEIAAEKARQEAALKAVNELFNSDKPSTDAIKETTTQDSIDAAQKLIDAITDPTIKAALQKDLDRAQELLDAREAELAAEKARQEAALKAVNELFNSDKPSTDAIKTTTDQAAIDAAQKLVDAITDPTIKAALQKDLDRAQELLDARNAELAAEKARQEAALKAVNELFNSDKPS
ncbi:toxin Cry1Ac domain D-VI-related protein, partial [Listeria booriae]|uniref:toxin Cry1Ac domain D-VI-related protein n=1 Tax=Listeria booriae TaxID=1552123 RepID=UPI0028801C93